MSTRVLFARSLVVGLALAGGLAASPLLAQDFTLPEKIVFDRDIRPILTNYCIACHGADKAEGGLRLTDRAGALATGESGEPCVVPGKPDASELVKRLHAEDEDTRMPPADARPLSPRQIALLEQWVREGATWSDHWCYQPLGTPAPPAVKQVDWVKNDLDRFILARLEAEGIAPSPEADRYTLIKRLSYDLLGLPPTIAEVDAFVKDASPQAYDQLVDRLLKSPHFGERWGRHWLDLAHFADSDGYEKDRARPDAYLFRDWVIKAMNDDLPYDRFTVAQLAGDLLPNATAQDRIATGFLRQTLTNEEGGVDQEEYRVAAVFDRTETVGTVWMGLTIGCVRCHGHKYDPLPLDEYYKLFAFFNNAEELTEPLPTTADNIGALEKELAPIDQALAKRFSELTPASQAWEQEHHQTIMAQANDDLQEHALPVAEVTSTAPDQVRFRVESDQVYVDPVATNATGTTAAPGPMPEKDTYVVTMQPKFSVRQITGFKLHALAQDSLPGKGPGRANGNFVVTGLRVQLVRSGQSPQLIDIHRPQADFSQSGYPAADALKGDTSGRSGWAVAGKTGVDHWLQVRTKQPIDVPDDAQLQVVIEQQFGGIHTLGRFRLAALTGNQRGLLIPDKEIADALEMYPEKRVAKTKQLLFDYFVDEVAKDESVAALKKQRTDVLAKHHAKLTEVRTIGTPRLPRSTKVFHRGDFLTTKHEVQPGTPAVLASFQPRGPVADRLDLAQWLTSKDNFLTPRVAVNQIWSHLFGAGLVPTMNDLGVRGEPPMNPVLLDFLARKFRDDFQWHRKELIRWIVSSATYRQSSVHRADAAAKDPTNRWLHRQNRFRVEAEIVRDLHLAVSGLLSPKIGGPSVFPPMPEDLAKLSYANSFTWKNSTGEDRYRRGLYTFFKRTIPHPNLTTFDCPDANVACAIRNVSNTPLQALTLLNNDSHVEAAQAFGRKSLETIASSDSDRLAWIVRTCVAREARPAELVALQKVVDASRAYYREHAEQARSLIGSYAPKAQEPAEAAAWVALCRVVLNYDEMITRE